jgi:hypothetical protein
VTWGHGGVIRLRFPIVQAPSPSTSVGSPGLASLSGSMGMSPTGTSSPREGISLRAHENQPALPICAHTVLIEILRALGVDVLPLDPCRTRRQGLDRCPGWEDWRGHGRGHVAGHRHTLPIRQPGRQYIRISAPCTRLMWEVRCTRIEDGVFHRLLCAPLPLC